jgi:hypothetical protein
MRALLIDECSFENLNKIDLDNCQQALSMLECLLKWQNSHQEKSELEDYITRLNNRIAFLQNLRPNQQK